MNKEIEEIIVKSFFNKRIQQRVLFELSSPKKRWDPLRGLRHKYYDTLRNEFMIKIPEPNSNFEKIAEMLKNHGAGEFCYSLSDCEEIKSKELPLLTALEKAVGYVMPSIISCISGKLAYFESEQSYGPPPRFILKRP
jgi:hypothetical protein